MQLRFRQAMLDCSVVAMVVAHSPPALSSPAATAPMRMDGLVAARMLFANIAASEVEIAAIAYLDADHRLLGMRHVRGTAGMVRIDIRRVAVDALSFGARAVVMAHNHPSGDVRPSNQDRTLVKRLARALDTLEVRLVDHLVMAGDAHSSMRALGLL